MSEFPVTNYDEIYALLLSAISAENWFNTAHKSVTSLKFDITLHWAKRSN